MGYPELNNGLDLITNNSAKVLHLEKYGIEEGFDANCLILPAENGFDALRRQVPTRYSIRRGKIIATTTLPETHIYLQSEEKIDYRR